ncbi:MAG TPA: hypothetical protein VJ787_00225 [Thermoleophilia bacterium]|nr:hypothetical protein [Thermoleophilia bacterium]
MPRDSDDLDAGDPDAGDDQFDLYEIIGDSNNGAYQRVEQRTGPPQAYVAEKSRRALEQIHVAYRSVGDGTGDRGAAQAAFHYSLVSYLALNNMLSLAADHGVVERLLTMSPVELGKWLDAIDAEGSVTG